MRDDLKTQQTIGNEHVKNNSDVRKLLEERGIAPEQVPRAKDLKKIERRHKKEQRKIGPETGD